MAERPGAILVSGSSQMIGDKETSCLNQSPPQGAIQTPRRAGESRAFPPSECDPQCSVAPGRATIYRWRLTPFGVREGYSIAGKKDDFFVFRCHESIIDQKTKNQEFFAGRTNCLGYALGLTECGDADLIKGAGSSSGDIFELGKVYPLLDAAGIGEVPLEEFLPFDKKYDEKYVAIDIWKVMNANAFHATVRAKIGNKTILISKDGRVKPVENFDAANCKEGVSLVTNTGVHYEHKPRLTMLIKKSAIGDWNVLKKAFSVR